MKHLAPWLKVIVYKVRLCRIIIILTNAPYMLWSLKLHLYCPVSETPTSHAKSRGRTTGKMVELYAAFTVLPMDGGARDAIIITLAGIFSHFVWYVVKHSWRLCFGDPASEAEKPKLHFDEQEFEVKELQLEQNKQQDISLKNLCKKLRKAQRDRDKYRDERDEYRWERVYNRIDLRSARWERDYAVRRRDEAYREREDACQDRDSARWQRDIARQERNEAYRERDKLRMTKPENGEILFTGNEMKYTKKATSSVRRNWRMTRYMRT